MKLGIMQPYLFPYIGYFQLIQATDVFVLHDDVQWIKGGWINRNRILIEGKLALWTLPVAKKKSDALINQCELADDMKGRIKIVRQIQNAYRQAPFFSAVMPLVEAIFKQPEKDVVKYIRYSLEQLITYMGLTTQLVMSSKISKDNSLKAQARVISICTALGADEYINPPGGVELYDHHDFARSGIALNFLQPGEISYPQLGNAFVPNLSIIDVLMFNSVESVRSLLKEFTLT